MVDIVIVNWNSGEYLMQCVSSILLRASEVDTIYIIDNHSNDDSIALLPKDAKIKIIHNDKNVGFAKACNQGFELCSSTYVLLLNPDTKILGNTFKDCSDFMNAHPDVDILGCQLLNEKGEISSSCARFPTALHIFYDASGLSKIAPRIFKPATLMTDWDHQSSRFVPQAIGAFMWMRRSIFKKIGYFDERFFVYFEELDFSKRLADNGGHTFFNAQIKNMHVGGGSTSSVKAFRLFLFWQSRLLYAKKHFNSLQYAVVVFSTYFIEPFSRWAFLLLKGDFKAMKEVWTAYLYLIKKKKQF